MFDANSAQTLTVLKRPVFCPGVIEDSRKTMRLSIFFARLGYLLAEDHAEHDDEHEITSCQALLEQQNVLLGHYSRILLDQSEQVRQCRRPAEDWVVDKNGHCVKVFLV